jgi:geranylgeranyl diphosphate synthase type I
LINQLASRYLADLDATMRRVVDDAITLPDFGVMLRYPLGWVDENGQPYNHPTGKRIRPILLLLCAEAVGGSYQTALPAAAAVELLHNFSLVHDDIEDDSPTRHGRPTVWTLWGRANAINAGDALFALAYSAMQRLAIPAEIAVKVWGIFNATNIELTRGQHMDMRFERQESCSVDEYLSMIRGKSAALVSACAQMGALIGSGDDETAAHFAEFGLNLGLAFQVRDDILGIWGDPAVTGKSAATDILARKKSLPVVCGLLRSAQLGELYGRDEFGQDEVSAAVGILDAVGAQTFAVEYESRYYRAALEALERADPKGSAAAGLMKLTEALFRRVY